MQVKKKQWFLVLVLNLLLLKHVRSARAKTYFGQRYATDGKTISPKPEQKENERYRKEIERCRATIIY